MIELFAAIAIALAPQAPVSPVDPFDQSSFPCQEDEVLGYAPQFGPDRVGCIHIDQIAVAHGVAAADGGAPGPGA